VVLWPRKYEVLIIGGGFGGISAAYRLSEFRKNLDITLIDKKEVSDFLPTMPDCLGRGIKPEFLSFKIENAAKRLGINFINEEVVAVNLDKKEVLTKKGSLGFDYLLIASGSETNFYGNENIRQCAYKLDEVEDARKIVSALNQGKFDNLIIGGGGYTGIEVATNLKVYLEKNKMDKKVIIIERAPSILGPLPQWMKDYVSANLQKLNVDVFVNSAIEKIESGKAYVAGGKVFDNAMVIWAAGVKTSGFIQNLGAEKNPQGRIKVDEFLRLNNNCFVIGDAAYFSYGNIFLRMAVQFAIAQGDISAVNIIRSIKGLPLRKYKPNDLGYIIPMANNRSCGAVFGINLKGFLPTMLHFSMCIYRSYGLKNKLGIIGGLLKGGG
jgi:NADH dehydrogenase